MVDGGNTTHLDTAGATPTMRQYANIGTMGHHAVISHSMGLERSSSVCQQFLCRLLASSTCRRSWALLISTPLDYIHFCGNDDFEPFLPIFGPSNSIESILFFGIVTSSTN
jgi:hypothetical protein